MSNYVNLKTASMAARDDFDTVINSIRGSTEQLKFASDRLKDNEDVIYYALKWGNPEYLQYASERIRSDRNFLKPLHSTRAYFQYVSDALKKDEDFCLEILKESENADLIGFVHEDLRYNLEFLKKAYAVNYLIFVAMYYGKIIIDDEELALFILKDSSSINLSERLKSDIGDKNPIEYLESKLANKI